MNAGQTTVPLLRWVRPNHWVLLDVLAGVGYGLLAFVGLANGASSLGGWLAATVGAVVLAVAIAARRRAPVASLVVLLAALGLMAAFAPSTVVFALPPVVLVLYTVAAETRFAVAVAALVTCAAVLATGWPDLLHPGGIAVSLPVFAGTWTIGAAFGMHRRHLRVQLELHERLRGAQERRAELELVEQRLRIARELHDVVAHGMSVITVQAGFAGLVADDPDEVRSALSSIETTGRQTLSEMRTLLEVLRDGTGVDEPTLSPVPGMDDLEALIGRIHTAGVDVVLTRGGPTTGLPPLVQLTAYRIVQEALTNVVKHAGSGAATVHLHCDGSELTVTIRDEGALTPTGSVEPGQGLTGMLERARILGGTLTAGPHPGGGYEVVARLPVTDRPATARVQTADRV